MSAKQLASCTYPSSHLTWVEIDASALRSNIRAIQRSVGPRMHLMPIIKSNAYGHGMLGVAHALKHTVRWFGVANSTEALQLRRHNIHQRIVVLSYFNAEEISECIENNIDLPIFDEHSYHQILRVAKQLGTRARVQIKIDVGTSRIGFRDEDTKSVQRILCDPFLSVAGIYSHYSSSEENQALTQEQLKLFSIQLQKFSPSPPAIHIACSAALCYTDLSNQTLVRVGLSTYGLQPSLHLPKNRNISFQPALTWKTRLLQVKSIPSGTSVGYGAQFTARRRMRIGVLPCGYFEGLPRSISPGGHVLIAGKRAKFLGRICMNLSMVDLTQIPSAKPGIPVILIGKSGTRTVTADDHARWTGTISYEVVTRIQPFLPRLFRSS
ncbi:MAG: alanine racemase [Candidatus Kerfeldbacteria bacterium]|nr:alanine racemase [Candidatus Kerfeldbacteria bacterium]